MSIVTDGLIAYYNSKQGVNGTTWSNLASTGTKYDGTLVNASIGANGMTFSSSVNGGSYVNIPKFSEIAGGTTSVTIEGRININNSSSSPDVYASGNSSGAVDYSLGYPSNAGQDFHIYMYGATPTGGSPPSYGFTFTNGFVDNTEFYFSIVYDNSQKLLSYYKNGVQVGTSQTVASNISFLIPDKDTNFFISDSSYPVNGVIDNFRVYNKALTTSEITQNYNNGTAVGLPIPTGVVTSGLVAYYNSKQGVNGTTWSNLAPTGSKYDITLNIINGGSYPTVTSGGMQFTNGYGRMSMPSELMNTGATDTPFTIELRLNPNDQAGTNLSTGPSVLRGFSASSSGYTNYIQYVDDTDSALLSLPDASNTLESYQDNTAMLYNQDHWVTITYDGTNINFYDNGNFTKSLPKNNGTTTFIGSTATNVISITDDQYPFIGIIDNIKFYNRALSATEVQQNYSNGTDIGLPNIVIDNLIAYYNSKQGVNSTTWSNLASTGTKYDGTLDVSAPPTVQSNGMTFSSTGTDVNFPAFDEFTNPTTNETIEFRINLNASTLQPIISDDSYNPIIYVYNGTDLHVAVYDMYGNQGLYQFNGAYTSGQDSYFTLTLDTSISQLTLYKNGAYFGYNPISTENSFFATFLDFYIGDQRNYYPTGVIDNIRFYTKVLSSDEVLQNYYVGTRVGLVQATTDITNLTEAHNNNTVRLTWLNPQVVYTGVNIYKNDNLLTILDNNNGGSYYDYSVSPNTTYNYKVTAIVNGTETVGMTVSSATTLLPTNDYIIYRQKPDYSVQIKGEITESSGNTPFSFDSQGNVFISGELVEYYPAATYNYSEASNSFSNGTNTNVTVSNNQLILSKTGTDINNTDNTQAQFATGTLSNVTTSGNSLVLTSSTIYQSVTEDFEDTTYQWSFSGTWTRTTTSGTYYAGTGGWASPSKASGTTSITVNLGQASTVSYWVKIIANTKSSTSFSIDGTDQGTAAKVSGNGSTSGTAWAQKTFNLSAGSHTLQWSYTNGSGSATGANQAYIDNIVVGGQPAQQYVSTGYRISPSIDLNSVGNVSHSAINWNNTQPVGTSMSIQTSLDNGTTWSNASVGATIPGIVNGNSISGSLLVKVILNASADLSLTPTLSSLTVTIQSSYNLSGNRVVTIPITLIPKVGSSTISWNVTTPSGTTFTVDVSGDNINWTTNVTNGSSIPVLTPGQAPPTNLYVKEKFNTTSLVNTPTLSDLTTSITSQSQTITQFQFDGTKLTTTELDENVTLS